MKIFKLNIIYLLVFFITFFSANNLYADKIKEFKVIGNERLAKETIILFSELSLGDEITSNNLNIALKNLFATNYFNDVNFEISNNILTISVKENPIIQKIIVNGVKNQSILTEIQKITKQSEKYPFVSSLIVNQKNTILNIVKSYGFYFADIKTKKIENSNNTLDLIYDLNLGERAKIKKINFIGNNLIKSNKLRKLIISEEAKPWKFITRNIYIDQNRITLDKNLLINYFKNRGYYNANVKSSFAKIVDENSFNLVFNIDIGKKFSFNNITLSLSEDYSNENFEDFKIFLKSFKNKTYSLNSIKKILKEIDNIILSKEFIFANAMYDEKIIDEDKIDINIYFNKPQKSFIDRINIFGNFITEEKVIRNSLLVDEGDAFNEILFNKSINEMKSRNIFKKVESDIKPSDINSNNKLIDIIVEEKPTGQIFAGAGTGTSGTSITAGIKENNYLGKGISLETNIVLSDDEIKGKFDVNNPNFRNSDRSMNFSIESTSSDFMTSSGYKTSRTGFSIGTGFEQYQDIFINLDVSNFYEKLETSDLATAHKKKQEGDYFENLFSYSLNLNKLNQNFQPTDGYYFGFAQTLPIISDDNAVENRVNYSKYYMINEELLLSAKFLARSINSLDSDVRVSKRIYIPSSRLRGFQAGSIGPKDGQQYIGGNYGSSLNLNSSLPKILKDFENIDFSFFLDAANLWHVDYDNSLDSNKLRSSTGISINWFTPIGPLSFSYAIPLSEANTDKTESFRFEIGTSF